MADPEKLFIVIGCDTDPDRVGFIDGISDNGLSWRGLSEGIPRIKEMLKDQKDHVGHCPTFTWLLRADEQIRTIYGEYNWVLSKYKQYLQELESSGDELAWHPHFYKLDTSTKKWYQELDNINWQCDMLVKSFDAYNNIFPGRPKSVRMGWDYHNNSTMAKLSELGIKVEFSAVPGLRTNRRKSGRFPYNIFDWYTTPDYMYFPSAQDYRRITVEGETALSIMEAPNFVSRSFLWGMISGLQMARKMKDPAQIVQALKRPTFFINLTGIPKLFSPMAKRLKEELAGSNKNSIYFISYFHPDELLENKSSLYSAENLKTNLMTILNLADRFDIPVEFIRAEQIEELAKSRNFML